MNFVVTKGSPQPIREAWTLERLTYERSVALGFAIDHQCFIRGSKERKIACNDKCPSPLSVLVRAQTLTLERPLTIVIHPTDTNAMSNGTTVWPVSADPNLWFGT